MLFASKPLYQSEKHFVLCDFVVSHGQLLLRAQKINDSRSVNTDIIFSDTVYVQLPAYFLNGIIISQNTKKRFGYEKIDEGLDKEWHRVFEIKDGNAKYYVVAWGFEVFENELPFDDTSLGVAQHKGRDKKVAGSL